ELFQSTLSARFKNLAALANGFAVKETQVHGRYASRGSFLQGLRLLMCSHRRDQPAKKPANPMAGFPLIIHCEGMRLNAIE
ncbi:MAG: hypothetical protein L7T26_04050, partial [Pseudomonadales bacterium]|nr:hypothetical protein [Pseudomonadales bacterium]